MGAQWNVRSPEVTQVPLMAQSGRSEPICRTAAIHPYIPSACILGDGPRDSECMVGSGPGCPSSASVQGSRDLLPAGEWIDAAMRILITGAGGFIGRRLVAALLDAGCLKRSDGMAEAITEIFIADRYPVQMPEAGDIHIHSLVGDLADPRFICQFADLRCDSIFHLAASLTLDAEQDAELAYAVNVAPLCHLLAQGVGPSQRLVFASSIAVFGGQLPTIVEDDVRASPTTTYGAHKAIAELLLADATRRRAIDARALRLPIVLIRPGAPTPAVSDQVAAIVREPLAGRDVICPFTPDTEVPVASAGAVATALMALHDLPSSSLPMSRAMNLPALTVSVASMIAAVERHGGSAAANRIHITPDVELQRIVDGWPKRFMSRAASQLGLRSDTDFDAIIADYLKAGDATGRLTA